MSSRPPLGTATGLRAQTRSTSAATSSTASVSISDSIEPNGQSRVPRNDSLIMLPTSQSLAPPRISGIANMPSTGMNTSAAPEKMPGSDSGKVTRQKRSQRLAPRSCAASSSTGSCFSRLVYSGRIMNGRCTKTMPTITAKRVNSRSNGPRMIIHAYTRTRKLLANGRITSSTIRSRRFLGMRAISIASG